MERSARRNTTPTFALNRQTALVEQLSDRTRRRPANTGATVQKPGAHFPGTPARMQCAHLNHPLCHRFAHTMRTIMRRVASLLKTDNPLRRVALDPFVPSLPAYLVAAAQFRDAQLILQIFRDEHSSPVHGTGLFPRHELPPCSCQPVTHQPGLLCYLSSRFGPPAKRAVGGLLDNPRAATSAHREARRVRSGFDPSLRGPA